MEVERLSRQMCDVEIHIVQHFSMTEFFFFFHQGSCVSRFIFFLFCFSSSETNINYFSYRSLRFEKRAKKKRESSRKVSKSKYLCVWCNDHHLAESGDLRGNVSNESQFEYFLLEGKQSHTADEETKFFLSRNIIKFYLIQCDREPSPFALYALVISQETSA